MNRWLLRFFGVGAWANSAWDFNAYFIHGEIIPYLHSWLVFVPIFGIFFGYPVAGLILIFGKMPLTMNISQSLGHLEIGFKTIPDIELET